jgi:endonuclease-3
MYICLGKELIFMLKTEANVFEIIKRLEKAYPKAKIALNYSNPLELLIATILSAQSTDIGVNRVTPAFFARYKTADDYANADVVELEALIKPTGFYHNKAKSIMGAAAIIARDFNGKVPETMEQIITLPGVARKTGNVVLYSAYGVLAGIAVDTHVMRLSRLLELSREKDPVKIEKDLMKLVPQKKWGEFSFLLIDHGRAVCIARKPRCEICVLNDICPSAFKSR